MAKQTPCSFLLLYLYMWTVERVQRLNYAAFVDTIVDNLNSMIH